MRESEVKMFVEHYGFKMIDFFKWMRGQTASYIYTKEKQPGNNRGILVEHINYYPQDVIRFITQGGKKAKVED